MEAAGDLTFQQREEEDSGTPHRGLKAQGLGNTIPGANVIPSSQPERVPHGWAQLCQLAVLLAPKEALSETAVSFSLKENNSVHKV